MASVASETSTVSQPTKTRYESTPGMTFPFTPNAARDRVMVGALDRLPASEETPTKIKEAITPIMAAQVACQKEIPKPKKKDPYDKAKSETFPAAHGQKRDRGLPERWCSSIMFMPFNSRRVVGVMAAIVLPDVIARAVNERSSCCDDFVHYFGLSHGHMDCSYS